MKKSTLVMIVLMLCSTMGFAQRIVNGKVISSEGIPLADVSVKQKNSDLVTYSRSNGEFTIEISTQNNTLVFEKEGYTKTEVEAGDEFLTVTMSLMPEDIFEMSLEDLLNVEVTTAGKQEQKISDIPASILVITKKDIQTYGYQNLTQIFQNVLGLYLIDNYTFKSFGVRGFYSNQPNKSIVLMVNGVSQKFPQNGFNDLSSINIQVESIERIEIVRGPVAVLYGNDAFFGAINIITKDEQSSPNSNVNVSYGMQNTLRANVNSNYAKDENSVSFSAGYAYTDGRDVDFNTMFDSVIRYDRVWIKDATTAGFFRNENKYVQLNTSLQNIYANLSFDATDENIINNLAPVLDTTKIRRVGDVFRGKFGYKGQLNDMMKLNVQFYFASRTATQTYNKAMVMPVNVRFGNAVTNGKELNTDVNLFVTPTENLNLTFGAFVSQIKMSEMIDIPQIGYSNEFTQLQKPLYNTSGYVLVDYKLGDKFIFQGGIRADKQFESNYLTSRFRGPTYIDTTYTYSNEDIQFSPKLAGIVKLNETNIIKLMFSQAISRPAAVENGYSLWQLHSILVPQQISTYEFNYSTVLFEKVSVSANIFFNKLDKLLVRTSKADLLTSKVIFDYNNLGKMQTLGGELQVTAKPIESVKLDIAMSYQTTTDNTYKEMDAAYSPNMLGYFKASYFVNENISLAISSFYVGEMESMWDNAPQDPTTGNFQPKGRVSQTIPAYFNLGANLLIDNILNKNIYFSLNGNNLLNTEIRYAPDPLNYSFMKRGTIESGILINATMGVRF